MLRTQFKRTFILWTALSLLLGAGKAQNQTQNEHTLRQLQGLADDTLKAKKLIDFGNVSDLTDSALALKAYRNALATSRKIRNSKYEIFSLRSMGVLYHFQGQLDKGQYYYEKALALAKSVKDEFLIAKIRIDVGHLFSAREDYRMALKCYLESEDYFRRTQNHSRLALVYQSISRLFDRQMLPDKAVEYAEKAIAEAKQSRNTEILGKAYMQASGPYSRAGNEEKMLEYALKSIPLLQKSPLDLEEAYLLAAFYYVENKMYPEAIIYAEKAYQYGKAINFTNAMPDACVLKARSLWEKGNFAQARPFLREALAYAKQDGGLLAMKQYHNTMFRFFNDQKNCDSAFFHYDEDRALEDSMKRETVRAGTMELEKKYETEKKQLQIKQLEKEKQIQILKIGKRNTWLTASLGGLVLAILLGFFIYRNSRQKQEIQARQIEDLKKEKQLEALSGIIKGEENERNRMAQDLHDGLGSLLSGVKLSLTSMKGGAIMSENQTELFGHSLEQLDGAIQEMRRVAHNLMPSVLVENGLVSALENFTQSLNESGQIKVYFEHFNVNERLNREQEIVAYRMSQEAVNNALKHADAKRIIIQLRKVENQIQIEVEDDGKGFEPSKISTAKAGGIQNLQHRAEYIKGTFEIRSEIGKGTTVAVGFPV